MAETERILAGIAEKMLSLKRELHNATTEMQVTILREITEGEALKHDLEVVVKQEQVQVLRKSYAKAHRDLMALEKLIVETGEEEAGAIDHVIEHLNHLISQLSPLGYRMSQAEILQKAGPKAISDASDVMGGHVVRDAYEDSKDHSWLTCDVLESLPGEWLSADQLRAKTELDMLTQELDAIRVRMGRERIVGDEKHELVDRIVAGMARQKVLEGLLHPVAADPVVAIPTTLFAMDSTNKAA